jgi:hypothetical protein
VSAGAACPTELRVAGDRPDCASGMSEGRGEWRPMLGMGGAARPHYIARCRCSASGLYLFEFSEQFGGRRPGGPAYGRAGGHCAHPALAVTVRVQATSADLNPLTRADLREVVLATDHSYGDFLVSRRRRLSCQGPTG